MNHNFILFQETVSASAQQLPSNQIFNNVILSAKSTNTGVVYIGNSSAVSSTSGFPLEKGTSVSIKVDNLNQIFFVGTAADVFSVIGS